MAVRARLYRRGPEVETPQHTPCLTITGYAVSSVNTQKPLAALIAAVFTAAAALGVSVGPLGMLAADERGGIALADPALPPIPAALGEGPLLAAAPTQITADLGVALTGPANAAPGGRVSLRMSVSNRSASLAGAVRVTNTLPVSVGVESISAGGTETAPGVVVWALGDLTGPITHTLEVTGRVSSNLSAGARLTDRVAVSTIAPDATPDDDVAHWQLLVGVHDLRPSIASAAATARPSERVTYTIGLDNVSTVPADDVVLSVTLGAGLRWLADTASAAGFVRVNPVVDGEAIRFERPRQAGPSSLDFEFIALTAHHLDAGAVVTAAVAVGSASLDGTNGGRTDSAPPVTIVIPDLRMSVRGGEVTALGSRTRYRTFWSNEMGAGARRAIMTSTIPAFVRYVTSTPPADLVDGTQIGPARLRWVLGPAPEGSGEIAGPEIVVDHDIALGVSGVFTTAFEMWDGARDAAPSDNSVLQRTELYSPLAARLSMSAPLSMRVEAEEMVRLLAVNGREEWVADGTPVHFEASAGEMADAMPTTVDGVATTAYRAPRTAGPVIVRASVDGISAAVGIDILAGEPMTVTPSAGPISAVVGTTITYAVEVVDRFENPVADGTPVRAEAASGRITPAIAETEEGRATFRWMGDAAGSRSITFRAGPPGAEVSGSDLVVWHAGAPARIALLAEPPIVGAAGGLVAVGAAVFDAFDNPVADGYPIHFEADGGSFVRPLESTVGGIATATWTSGTEIGDIGLWATFERGGGLPPFTANTSVTVAPADLGITALISGPRGPLDDARQIHPGERLSLTLGIRNAGVATARGVIVSARLPPPLLDVIATTDAGVVLPEPVDPPTSVEADAWSVPNLASGATLTVTIAGTLDRDHPWTGADLFFVRGAVTSTTPEASAFDLVRTQQVRVSASDLFLDVAVAATASAINPGGRLVYDVAVGNLQPQTNVVDALITTTVPAGTSFDRWSVASGAPLRLEEVAPLDAESETLVWRVIGSMPASSGFRLWLNIDADVRGDSEISTHMEVDSTVYDIDPINNASEATVLLPGGVNLVSTIDGPASAHPGEVVTHDLIIRNLARTEPAADVIVNSYLPPDVDILEVAEPGRIVGPGRAQWQFERLGPGGRPMLWIRWRAPTDGRTGESIAHRVEVTAAGDDTNDDDNVAEHTTTIIPGPPATIALRADPNPLDACPAGRAVVSAEIADMAGNPVADGVAVAWTSTLGALDAPSAIVVGGVATTALIADGFAGRATVRASSGPVVASIDIALRSGPPADIALGVSPEVGIVGEAMEILVALNDGCGNPVADGTAIRVAVSRGDLGGGALERVVTADGGIASATLIVGAAVGPLRVEASAVERPELRAERFLRVEAPPRTSRRIWMPFAMRGATQGGR